MGSTKLYVFNYFANMKSETDTKICEIVKKKRQELKISQRTLAEIIGTTHGFVGKVENPKSHCKYSATHLLLIAKYFGCQVSDLFPPINPLEP